MEASLWKTINLNWFFLTINFPVLLINTGMRVKSSSCTVLSIAVLTQRRKFIAAYSWLGYRFAEIRMCAVGSCS